MFPIKVGYAKCDNCDEVFIDDIPVMGALTCPNCKAAVLRDFVPEQQGRDSDDISNKSILTLRREDCSDVVVDIDFDMYSEENNTTPCTVRFNGKNGLERFKCEAWDKDLIELGIQVMRKVRRTYP